jgi:hypothetical protein
MPLSIAEDRDESLKGLVSIASIIFSHPVELIV